MAPGVLYSEDELKAILVEGSRGQKVERAAANLPQTTNSPIFLVIGGRVKVTGIVGQVSTVLGGADNLKLIAVPDVGRPNDMCAVVAADDAEVGALFSITGIPADAMNGDPAKSGAVADMKNPIIVAPGEINLDASASRTGKMKWTLTYIPVDDGAYVVPA